MTAERRQRNRAPWRDDFDGTMDRLSTTLGGACRYSAEDQEILCRTKQAWDVLAERVPNRQAAYWWALGRLAGEIAGEIAGELAAEGGAE